MAPCWFIVRSWPWKQSVSVGNEILKFDYHRCPFNVINKRTRLCVLFWRIMSLSLVKQYFGHTCHKCVQYLTIYEAIQYNVELFVIWYGTFIALKIQCEGFKINWLKWEQKVSLYQFIISWNNRNTCIFFSSEGVFSHVSKSNTGSGVKIVSKMKVSLLSSMNCIMV